MPRQLWGIDTRRQALHTGGDAPPNSGPSNTPDLPPGFGFTDKYGQNPFTTPNQVAASFGTTPEAMGLNTSGQGPTKGKKKRPSPDDIMQLLNDYFTRKNKGLDFNDPRTQSILNNARNTTMQGQNDRGIYGGYSENAAESSYIKAAAGLQQQDDAMGLQALIAMSGLSTGIADREFQSEMAQWNKENENNTGLGEMIGGGLGAGLGALGFLVPSVGPVLGPATMAAGSKIGAGIGGGIGGSQSRPMPQWGGY